jgi:hypothetical protein
MPLSSAPSLSLSLSHTLSLSLSLSLSSLLYPYRRSRAAAGSGGHPAPAPRRGAHGGRRAAAGDAFDLAALGQAGGASPPLYGRAKSLKSLDFDGVSRGQTFASHMTRDAGREGRGSREGRTTSWRGRRWGRSLQPGVGRRRARRGENWINIITLTLTLNYIITGT